MEKHIFLYKENDTDDRDCVAYIDFKNLQKYPPNVKIYGSCYYIGLTEATVDYDCITTILNKNEFKTLCNPAGGDLTDIIAKLTSEENKELTNKIANEEKEYLIDEYSFTEDDIEYIFNNTDYIDRSVVECVFDDTYDLGYEEAISCGYVDMNNDIQSRYFDFERFGEDLLDDYGYIQLDDGRCVRINAY